MSELQIALIVFGALLVVVVWIYNLRQERKLRAQAEQLLKPTQPDVLMADRGEERTEPAIATAAEPQAREPTLEPLPEQAPDPVAPVVAPLDVPAAAPVQEVDLLLDDVEEARSVTPVPEEWGDGQVDCLLRVEFVKAMPAATLRGEHAAWSSRLDKPIQWLGLDAHSGRWRTLLPQDPGSVAQLAAALQLVDRKGPVSEITLSAFIDGMHRLAQRCAGLVDLPAVQPLQARARDLDAFCASVDLQLTLHVLPAAGEFAGARLKPLIEAAGLRLEGERFVATDAAGAEAFALTCQAATAFPLERLDALALTGLVFSLDVPRVADGAAVFERMVGFARQCAEALGGQLTDAHRKPLAEATIAAIHGRITELQGKMAERGMPAGGIRALRLFS